LENIHRKRYKNWDEYKPSLSYPDKEKNMKIFKEGGGDGFLPYHTFLCMDACVPELRQNGSGDDDDERAKDKYEPGGGEHDRSVAEK